MTDKESQPRKGGQPRKSWTEMAAERNARVILCHAPDTYMLTDLTRAADRAIRYLRDQAFTFLPFEVAKSLFDEYNKSVLSLYQAVAKISQEVNVNYRPSPSLVKWLETQGITHSTDETSGGGPKAK